VSINKAILRRFQATTLQSAPHLVTPNRLNGTFAGKWCQSLKENKVE
jgi:hypothetical protein